jgi:SAM-dependent methyltransferase
MGALAVGTPSPGFDAYFQKRARRFARFYSSEPVARALGRGALFERLRQTVAIAGELGATSVLDVGCGSGPLFAPLAEQGIRVTGIDPAPAMVAMARAEATRFPGLVEVREGRWEDIDDLDGYDLAVALGVFDYVNNPSDLLARMGRAAPVAVGSFPSPGLRLQLRRVRYGWRGVGVYGYRPEELNRVASAAGMAMAELRDLGSGHLARFRRA